MIDSSIVVLAWEVQEEITEIGNDLKVIKSTCKPDATKSLVLCKIPDNKLGHKY